jgi:hypothetical protein
MKFRFSNRRRAFAIISKTLSNCWAAVRAIQFGIYEMGTRGYELQVHVCVKLERGYRFPVPTAACAVSGSLTAGQVRVFSFRLYES